MRLIGAARESGDNLQQLKESPENITVSIANVP